MKKTTLILGAAAVSIAIFLVVGCQPSIQQGSTGAFGITFDVTTTTPGAGTMPGIAVSTVENKYAKIQIRDVKIELAEVKDGPSYSLTIDGKSYSTVQSGDKVVVSASRQVNVNGVQRQIEE